MIKKLILIILSLGSLTSCMGNMIDRINMHHNSLGPIPQVYSQLKLFVLKDNALYSSYNMHFNEHLKLKVYGCSYSFQTVELNLHEVDLSIDGIPTIDALDIIENFNQVRTFDLTASLNGYNFNRSNHLTIALYDWYRPNHQVPNIRVSPYNICK